MSPPAGTASTLRRARSPMAWARLVAGLWLFAAGVVLGLRSRLGVGLVALGSALYIGAGLGSGPRDSLMLAISARTGLRVGVVRAIIETTVLVAGVLLGGAAGIGTILFAFGIGPAVEVAFRLLRVEVPSRKAARVEACETC